MVCDMVIGARTQPILPRCIRRREAKALVKKCSEGFYWVPLYLAQIIMMRTIRKLRK